MLYTAGKGGDAVRFWIYFEIKANETNEWALWKRRKTRMNLRVILKT